MRYDAEHKERTRDRVLAEAARALRTSGPERLGVAEVMKAAGLTHGGFYAHFPSKDALIAEAMDRAFGDSAVIYRRAVDGRPPREALGALVRAYVSTAHRDAPASGCVLPALSADLSRMGPAARGRFGAGLQRLTARMRALMTDAGVAEAETLAPSVVAEMVGAVALARAVADPEQSDAILRTSRQALLARIGLGDVS